MHIVKQWTLGHLDRQTDSAIPSFNKFALSSSNFTLAASIRLGLPIPFPEWVNKCDCGRSIDVDGFDADGFHLLTCKTGGGPVWTHDSMVSVWAECLGSLNLHHKCEPRDRYTNSNNRADILILDSETGSNVELDVALAHPWATDILLRAVTTGGSAALRREQIKENKYIEERLPGRYSPTVVALVFEHFGRWGKKPWIT